MTKQVGACCSSPAAICYWFIVSLMAWAVLSLIGIYWRPLHASSTATCLFAMAIGCLANWLRNRSFHCAITGPLFLISGVMFLLSGLRMIHFDTRGSGQSFSSASVSRFFWNGCMGSVLIVEKSPCSLLLAAACGKTSVRDVGAKETYRPSW
jgi:hypothetical protein